MTIHTIDQRKDQHLNKNEMMMNKRILLPFLVGTCLTLAAMSQTVENPNYALKSHETLEIAKIELTPAATLFYMSVENRATGGYFCADRNTFIIYPDGERVRLISSSGIPVCPDTYKFRLTGEKLDFILTFPPLKPGTEWIDLVEDCQEYCYSFYRVIIDGGINAQIEDAYSPAERGEPSLALDRFIKMARETGSDNMGFGGLLYLNIIKLAEEAGNKKVASDWYSRLVSSEIPDLEHFIEHLNAQGIKY